MADTDLTLKISKKNPQQSTHHFSDVGITISSHFDSGNMCFCKQAIGDPKFFDIHVTGDGQPYTTGHYRTWFYFSVKGCTAGDVLTFSVKSMAQQGKLYNYGLRPVYRTLPNAPKWRRCGGAVTWDGIGIENGFNLTWTHTFNTHNRERGDATYFAWTYPYSFQDSLE